MIFLFSHLFCHTLNPLLPVKKITPLRLDQLLVKRGLAQSRTQSQKMILAGQVQAKVSGQWAIQGKPSIKFDDDVLLDVTLGDEQKYASRAGLKLEGALDHIDLSVQGGLALDVGQSTGGFTDCLLRRGASHIVGVDVGRDQLVDHLRSDERITCIEKTNARELSSKTLKAASGFSQFDVIVMDVSFISQSLILPQLPALLKPGGTLVSLVKPQFEVGSEGISKGGIVKDVSLYAVVEKRLCEQASLLGFSVENYFNSPIEGGDGNREFFLCAKKSV